MTELPHFVEQDFEAYSDSRQRDPEYNGFRLVVRRKLDAHGKHVQKYLKKAGVALGCRTSLNHPHASNRNRVSRQLAYLSRAPKDKKELNALVGPALAKDVDTNYIQTTLALEVDAEGFEQALRIHSQAWWDGINLKNRVQEDAELDGFGDLLNAMPQGFVLRMDTWKLDYVPGKIGPQDLQQYFGSYTPGEHWLHLRRRLPKEVVIQLGTKIADFAEEGMRALAEVYRFIAWSPDNNWLFDEDGRIKR